MQRARTMSGLTVGVIALVVIAGGVLFAAADPLAQRFWHHRSPHPHGGWLRTAPLVGREEAQVVARAGEPDARRDRVWYDLGGGGPGVGDPYLELELDLRVRTVRAVRAAGLPTAPGASFDRARWLAAGPAQRLALAKGLLRDHPLEGMSLSAVRDLLGPPGGRLRELVYEDRDPGVFSPNLLVRLLLDADDRVAARTVVEE